jgi:hypothetical protein
MIVQACLNGISTGAWIEKSDDRLLEYVARWSVLPDYASVNLSEKNTPALIERLHRLGVAVEAGLAQPTDARRLNPMLSWLRRRLIWLGQLSSRTAHENPNRFRASSSAYDPFAVSRNSQPEHNVAKVWWLATELDASRHLYRVIHSNTD